ncbi:MAG TPA: BamA/TamA family outer membrane protein, partial [Kofleriaceae bacterium]
SASAEPQPPSEPAAQPPRELTAADVAADPVPGQESGRADPGDGDSMARRIGRGLLYLPRLAIDLALTPPRVAIWANDRYHLLDWYDRLFFNDTHTIGLSPIVAIDTTLGVTAGAEFVHRDLLGEHEQFGLQASIGSWYRQIYAARLATGNRLGDRLSLELEARYERRPHDAFYGIGNGDRVAAGGAPIDPRVDSISDPTSDPTSIEAYYRQDRSRLATSADLRAWRGLHLRGSAEISRVEFGTPTQGESITRVYDPSGLVGWGGYRYGYGELELRWDSRRRATVMEPSAVYSAGELAAVFGGRTHRPGGGPDFWRYGLDLEKFVRLAEGPRVLIAQLHGEAVTGRRDEVPFTELPKLGGPTYLRGYAFDRFRDRVAAFGSLAYEWDLSQWFSASVFADVGRVYPALTELSLDRLRVGYGVSIEAHRVESFLVAASIGSSIDGGVFLGLSFSPVHDVKERVRRQ